MSGDLYVEPGAVRLMAQRISENSTAVGAIPCGQQVGEVSSGLTGATVGAASAEAAHAARAALKSLGSRVLDVSTKAGACVTEYEKTDHDASGAVSKTGDHL